MSKVKLQRSIHENDPRLKSKPAMPRITHMLPYYISGRGKYYHRVRSAANHACGDKGYTHTSISFWCGNTGFIGNGKGKLYKQIPEGGILCATCEGRAIGAGMDGAPVINGKEVCYSPRKESDDD